MLNLAYKEKLILGTASFKSSYGLDANSRLKKKELNEIFKYCLNEKIIYLDSANDYKLKSFSNYSSNLNAFKIIFKINFNTKKEKVYNQLEKEIFSLVKKFLSKNKIQKLYCVMLHSEDTMTSENKIKIYEILSSLKKKKLTEKIGLSGYNLINIIKIIKKFNFDILQFPYNLFDQRINNKKILKTLKERNIELHIRSIFLQGIFFINNSKLPTYFDRWKKLFIKIEEILKKKNLNILGLCLSHAFKLNYNNKKIIFGIKSLKQLHEIKNTKLYNDISFVKKFKNNEKKLIIPFLWKIKKK
jgi:aryl-alcohol dehydrogenase-like predicted oxidoreductase